MPEVPGVLECQEFHEGNESVFKSAQPVTCTYGYSLFYSLVYRAVYRTVYSVLFSLVLSTCTVWVYGMLSKTQLNQIETEVRTDG